MSQVQTTVPQVKTGPVTIVRTDAKKVVPVAIKFALKNGARPTAGNRLFSYTMAWLGESGMLTDGAKVARAQLTQIAGSTAVAYHLSKGNLEATDAGIGLTDAGFSYFLTRGHDPKAVEVYASIMRDGKPDGEFVKNAEFIRAI